MGATKSTLFTAEQNALAAMAKALAHPARMAILQHLIRLDTCICSNLVDELGLAQATISQHLKELKTAGLIQGTVAGTSVCYCIDPAAWNRYRALFASFFAAKPKKQRCC